MERPAPGKISGFSLDCNGTEKKTSLFTVGEQTNFFLHLVLKLQAISPAVGSITQPYLQCHPPPTITCRVSLFCSFFSVILTPLIGKPGNFLASTV